MSQLFEHNGAEGKGYSQPDPIMSTDNLHIPNKPNQIKKSQMAENFRAGNGKALYLAKL